RIKSMAGRCELHRHVSFRLRRYGGSTPGDDGAETTGGSGAPRSRQTYPVVVVVPVPRIGWQPDPVGRHRPRSARPVRRLRGPAAVAVWHLRGRLRLSIHTPAGRSRAAMPLELPPVVDLRGPERCDGRGAQLRRTVRVVHNEAVGVDRERIAASGWMVHRAARSPRPVVLL